MRQKLSYEWYFPGAPVIKNPPSNAGDWVWSLVRELRYHMPWSNEACELQLKSFHEEPALHNQDLVQPNKKEKKKEREKEYSLKKN